MPKAGSGEFVADKGDAAKDRRNPEASKPKKWNEFSGIRKIHRTCRTKWVLTNFSLRQTPLLHRAAARTNQKMPVVRMGDARDLQEVERQMKGSGATQSSCVDPPPLFFCKC